MAGGAPSLDRRTVLGAAVVGPLGSWLAQPASAALSTGKPAGLSLAFIRDGTVGATEVSGYADREGGLLVQPSTRFQVASISKPITAMAALGMVEDGKLDLDAPVLDRLTTWRPPQAEIAAWREVTLRRLLSHSAGLSTPSFDGYAVGVALPTVAQIHDGAAPANSTAVRVDGPVGSEWRYSGGGYTVIQALVSEAAGQPFEAVVAERVFRPLGMNESHLQQPPGAGERPHAARGYLADGSAVPGGWPVHPELAAAGVWSTARDIAKFAAAMMQPSPVSAFVRRAMLTPQGDLVSRGLPFSLAFRLGLPGETPSFRHSGSNVGFRAWVEGYPERGEGVAILSNSDAGQAVIAPLLRNLRRANGWPARD